MAGDIYKKRLVVIKHGDMLARMRGKEDLQAKDQDLDLHSADDLDRPSMVYVGANPDTGRLNPELEAWIQTLRMATLVKEVRNWHPQLPPRAMTKGLLDDVIYTLNERTLKSLMWSGNCAMVKACPPNGHPRTTKRKRGLPGLASQRAG